MSGSVALEIFIFLVWQVCSDILHVCAVIQPPSCQSPVVLYFHNRIVLKKCRAAASTQVLEYFSSNKLLEYSILSIFGYQRFNLLRCSGLEMKQHMWKPKQIFKCRWLTCSVLSKIWYTLGHATQSIWAEREWSGKRSGAGRKSGGAKRSVKRAWQKTMERERSRSGAVSGRSRCGNGAWSRGLQKQVGARSGFFAAHAPLTCSDATLRTVRAKEASEKNESYYSPVKHPSPLEVYQRLDPELNLKNWLS